jgi:hypothetical protein
LSVGALGLGRVKRGVRVRSRVDIGEGLGTLGMAMQFDDVGDGLEPL